MVTPSYFPIKGGAESVIKTLAINLNRVGVPTDIMAFNMDSKWKPYWRGKVEKIDGLNVLKIPGLNWLPRVHSDRIMNGVNLIPGQFRKHLKKYEIVHFHVGDLSFPLFSYGVKTSKIAQFHGPLSYYKRYAFGRLVINKMADRYIAISRLMQRELVELGVQSSKISYLPNAVNTQVFHPNGNKEENLVLFVGRITFNKGLHVLLQSLKYVKTRTKLVIVGPPDYDLAYFQSIQEQIARENEKGIHVIKYVGAQEESSIARWCQKASILVLPSFREASSMVSLEALSSATPVIATDIGGLREIVLNGKNGIIVPPNNVPKLASSIQYLLDNEGIRTNFGSYGREFVLQHFSYEAAVRKLLKIYEQFYNVG